VQLGKIVASNFGPRERSIRGIIEELTYLQQVFSLLPSALNVHN
jgi:hypothetical protein